LAYLAVSEGSDVKSGDVIARLDNADYEAQVTQAQAGVANARAQLIEAQAERDQLQREAQRVQEIRAQNAQLVSQQDVDASESRAAQADARARAAAARIEAAEAALRFAQASLENTLIRAPFSGTGARGDFLEPERPAAARGAAPTTPLRIRVPAGAVRERDGQTVVWLVRNGRLEPRVVQAGPVSGEFREIRSGLSGGELVLVGGVETPRMGLRVQATTP